jgi:hypothetical protein
MCSNLRDQMPALEYETLALVRLVDDKWLERRTSTSVLLYRTSNSPSFPRRRESNFVEMPQLNKNLDSRLCGNDGN